MLLPESDPEDDVNNKRNINSLEKGNEFDANSENNIVNLLQNNFLMIDDSLDAENGSITYHLGI